jgi:hypothetical protein
MLTLAAIAPAAGQSATEVWPEVDLYWQPALHQRTFFELSTSSEREGTKREGSVGLYQDYLRLPSGYFRFGYRYTRSLKDNTYRESRVVGEVTLAAYSSRRFPRLRLVNRTRGELRFVNEEGSYRLRDRIHLQRVPLDSSGRMFAPYGTFEAYYDSRYNTVARLAGRVGTEMRLWGPIGTDIYVARQDNSRGSPKAVNALGVTLKVVLR